MTIFSDRRGFSVDLGPYNYLRQTDRGLRFSNRTVICLRSSRFIDRSELRTIQLLAHRISVAGEIVDVLVDLFLIAFVLYNFPELIGLRVGLVDEYLHERGRINRRH